MSDIIAGDPAPTNPTPLVDAERLAEIKSLLRYESSIAFYSSRAKESMLLLVAEVERLQQQEQTDRAEVLAERDAKLLCSALNLGEGSDAFIADYDARKRAEVLAEAADRAEELRQFDAAWGARKSAQVSENVGVLRVADELRRLAAEAGESRG